jgi:nucleotide-binding universal stress UspA family protein
MINVKKILYPTDFSSYSNQAYFHAITLAESQGASLTIMFVYAPSQGTAETPSSGAEDLSYWRSQLEQIRPTNPDIPVDHVLLQGDPATEIVRHAAETNMDLIVMGTHGRTGLERLLVGSVAEKVMRDALCSVLVVKLPKRVGVSERPEMALAVSPG